MNAKKILAVLSFLLIAIFLMACNQEDQVLTPDNSLKQQELTSVEIDPVETEGLIYMVLVEKLARDVYTYLGEKEDSYPAFLNIASSEQKHMAQILKLLVKYGIDNPLDDPDVFGVFPDEDFQDMYDDYKAGLLINGQEYENPLEVGIEIEEFIIAELNAQLLVVETQDIINVYNCLLVASEKHLVAFTK